MQACEHFEEETDQDHIHNRETATSHPTDIGKKKKTRNALIKRKIQVFSKQDPSSIKPLFKSHTKLYYFI